jgi:hypothetical protein
LLSKEIVIFEINQFEETKKNVDPVQWLDMTYVLQLLTSRVVDLVAENPPNAMRC